MTFRCNAIDGRKWTLYLKVAKTSPFRKDWYFNNPVVFGVWVGPYLFVWYKDAL